MSEKAIREQREEERYGRRSEDGVEWKSPLGPIRATGRVAVGLMLAMGIAYLLYKHDEKTEKYQTEVMQALDAMVYVIALKAEERERLKMEMPESLRRRLAGRPL